MRWLLASLLWLLVYPSALDAQPARFTVVIASWYGYESGRRTANGEIFNPLALTAAHRTLPFHTRLRVTHLRNKRHVTVRINDRGPFIRGRSLDLSLGAARVLKMEQEGVARVQIELVTPEM